MCWKPGRTTAPPGGQNNTNCLQTKWLYLWGVYIWIILWFVTETEALRLIPPFLLLQVPETRREQKVEAQNGREKKDSESWVQRGKKGNFLCKTGRNIRCFYGLRNPISYSSAKRLVLFISSNDYEHLLFEHFVHFFCFTTITLLFQLSFRVFKLP